MPTWFSGGAADRGRRGRGIQALLLGSSRRRRKPSETFPRFGDELFWIVVDAEQPALLGRQRSYAHEVASAVHVSVTQGDEEYGFFAGDAMLAHRLANLLLELLINRQAIHPSLSNKATIAASIAVKSRSFHCSG